MTLCSLRMGSGSRLWWDGGGGGEGRENEQCLELKMQPSDLKLCLLWPRALQNDASLRHGLPHLKLEINYDHDINAGIKSVSVVFVHNWNMTDSAALPRLHRQKISSMIKLVLLSAPHPAFCHLQCRKPSQVTESWGGARKQGYRICLSNIEGSKLIMYLSAKEFRITQNTIQFHKY